MCCAIYITVIRSLAMIKAWFSSTMETLPLHIKVAWQLVVASWTRNDDSVAATDSAK